MFGMGHVRANYSLGLVESDLGRIVVRLRAYKVLLVSHVRLDWILFVSFVWVPPTNSETPSDLIYLADSSGS